MIDPIENKATIVSTMSKSSPPNFRPRPLTNTSLLKLFLKLLVFCFRISDSRYLLVRSGGPCTRRKLFNCLSKIGTGVWKRRKRSIYRQGKSEFYKYLLIPESDAEKIRLMVCKLFFKSQTMSYLKDSPKNIFSTGWSG